MPNQKLPIVPLASMQDGEEADFFVLLSSKQSARTRDGRPYWKVTFRDAQREVGFPVWEDSPWAQDCAERWQPGEFYKLRAAYRETQFGPQLEIRKIRPVEPADRDDGFDPGMCQARTRFDPEAMWADLLALVAEKIDDPPLRSLVERLLLDNEESLRTMPAARRNHHAFLGGLLEHVLSVTRTAVYLAEKYAAYYDEMRPPLDTGLVVAGAVLHDIGKVQEYRCGPEGAEYSPAGHLVGHIVLGRDLLRAAAADCPVDAETLLRLEHVIVSHHRLKEYGSPKPPMTPEALLVHYADEMDARMNMVFTLLRDDVQAGPMTAGRNVLGHPLFRGLGEKDTGETEG